MNDAVLADVWEGEPVEHWRRVWRLPDLRVYLRVGSTNDVARVLAEAGAPAGTAVLADAQTAGRGRAGRAWHAPPSRALLMSIVFRPALGTADPDPELGPAPQAAPLRAGLAVARAIEAVAPLRVRLKWPNDLVLSERGKVGGILCEGALGEAGGHLVVGVGVNVAQRKEDWPPELRRSAVSLEEAAGRRISRAALAGAVLDELFHRAGPDLVAPLDPTALHEYARRDALRGLPIAVGGRPAGTAAGILPDGSLRVRGADGRVRTLRAGTVRPLAALPPSTGPTP